jgi:hypothetical protein
VKRGGPLKRTKPLTSSTPFNPGSGLRRTSPLAQQAGRESLSARATPLRRSAIAKSAPKPAVPPKQRDRARERADGWCEIRQAGCWGRGTDPSHRVSRKMGGRHGAAAVESAQLSCLVWACRACHAMCHHKPLFAERMGWFVREGIDPRTVPVLIGGRRVLLDDEGGMTDESTGDRVA